jgi:hypothetical protein
MKAVIASIVLGPAKGWAVSIMFFPWHWTMWSFVLLAALMMVGVMEKY